MTWEGQQKRVRVPYAKEDCSEAESRVPPDTRNPVGIRVDHHKYYLMTDSEKYCEGKVKRTPGGE